MGGTSDNNPETDPTTYGSPAPAAGGISDGNLAEETIVSDGMTERDLLTAPAMEREGFTQVAVGDISIDLLMGKTVYGADDSNVGTVDDVIVNESGAVQDIIVDFGGFLGMGTTQVALSFDEMTILTNEGNTDVRVYVDATKEQVQSLPTYTPAN